MNQELRRKQLHRTTLMVFEGDTTALAAAREKINTEFVKNKHVSNADAVEELITVGQQVEEILRTSVIQAVRKDDGCYRARILGQTTRLDNKPYQPMPESMVKSFKKTTKCN
ncbi:complex III assembly factor LYRM7 isoform X2 [Cherax quadricarinatus]|uniref:complex III assembly factor LYRM7 isoform X2 n=1 Tax=Cherax quadricarinatus TaxID=27406 RepID=UPI002378CB02|nr:complex III assembly factor LYRM7-like isoform X2 [Cherax quadricarinatus]